MSSSPLATPRPNRVKRKPAPAVDVPAKYPEPDPADPFAPLSVLRSRSSGAALASQDNLCAQLGPQQLPVLGIYPSLSHTADLYGARPKSSSAAKPARESHYRTRSQSVAAFQPPTSSPYGFWHQQSFILEPDILPSPPQPPGLVHDDSSGSGTDSELEFLPVHPRSRVPHFFSPPRKIGSQQFDRPRTSDCVPSKLNKVSSLSPVHPPTPSRRQRKAHSTLLFSKQRPSTADSSASSDIDYLGQPEPARLSPQQKRISFSPVVDATATPSPDSSSTASSYVHVQSPSESSSATTYEPPSSSTSGYSGPFSVSTSMREATSPSVLLSTRPPPDPSTCTAPSESHEWALPTASQLACAGSLSIIAHNGLRVPFSSLFDSQRTIVIFIRHFWCPSCQDYVAQLTRLVDPTLLAVSGLRLAIIGNGSPGMIAKYKQMFNTPFDMYTDPSLKVYDALGMTQVRKGTKKARRMGEPSESVKRGPMSGFATVVFRALKVGLPLWEKGGDSRQLGGEFVFGPRSTCTYAHRMQSTRGHVPILDVLRSIGVCVPPPDPYIPYLEISPTSCLGSPKEILFNRTSMDVRPPQRPISKPLAPNLPMNVRRRSFAYASPPDSGPAEVADIGAPHALAGQSNDGMKELSVIDIRRDESISSAGSASASSPATSEATTAVESLDGAPNGGNLISNLPQNEEGTSASEPVQEGECVEPDEATGEKCLDNVHLEEPRPLSTDHTELATGGSDCLNDTSREMGTQHSHASASDPLPLAEQHPATDADNSSSLGQAL